MKSGHRVSIPSFIYMNSPLFELGIAVLSQYNVIFYHRKLKDAIYFARVTRALLRILILEGSLVGLEFKDGFSVFPVMEVSLAGSGFVNGPAHITAHGRGQRMALLFKTLYGQLFVALFDDDLAIVDVDSSGAQVGAKAIFLALIVDGADDTGEMKTAEGNIGHRQHHRSARETALGPDIVLREGSAPVAFNIAHAVGEFKTLSVDFQMSVDAVAHTEYAVTALHKGDIFERTHDVIGNGGEGTEGDTAHSVQIGGMHIQGKSDFVKSVGANLYGSISFNEGFVGIGDIPGSVVRDQLQGTGLFSVGDVIGRNQGDGLLAVLTFQIPAAKIVSHGKSPFLFL